MNALQDLVTTQNYFTVPLGVRNPAFENPWSRLHPFSSGVELYKIPIETQMWIPFLYFVHVRCQSKTGR